MINGDSLLEWDLDTIRMPFEFKKAYIIWHLCLNQQYYTVSQENICRNCKQKAPNHLILQRDLLNAI